MLKVIKLRKQLEVKKAELAAVRKKMEGYALRETELATALDEAVTDEDINLVDSDIEALEADQTAAESEEKTLTEAIAGIERQLNEIAEKEKSMEGRGNNNMGKEAGKVAFGTRQRDLEYLQREDVKGFYTELREAIMQKRALAGTDLIIPTVVMDRIELQLGDYSNLYKEIDLVPVNGKGRVILDGANPEAIWTEMCDEVKEMETAFKAVEFDGFKVGGFIPVCNAILEDAMINLASYVEQRIAKAIAKALDKAILKGQGSTQKQPSGIITKLPDTNKVPVSDITIPNILKHVGLIDDGESTVGEIIAVVKRKTWYEKLMPLTYAVAATGTQVIVNAQNPHLAGFRVVFSNNMDDDKILLGDFKRYMLVERGAVTLSKSEHVRFIQDQTVFKGTARYDGQPTNEKAFVLVTLGDVAEPEEPEA